MSFRDVKIKIPDRKCDQGDVNDVMHRKLARRIFGDLRKVIELSFSVRRRRLTFGARRGLAAGAARGGGGGGADRKVSIERLSISLLMSKNLLTQR